jgi:hypothetical protein
VKESELRDLGRGYRKYQECFVFLAIAAESISGRQSGTVRGLERRLKDLSHVDDEVLGRVLMQELQLAEEFQESSANH